MLKYPLTIISIILNIIFISVILTSNNNNVERVYSVTADGKKKYDEIIESDNEIHKRVLIDTKLDEEIIYFKSGQIKEVRKYKDGKKDGSWIIYYENNNPLSKNKIKKESQYIDDILQESVKYNRDGIIEQLSLPESKRITMVTNYYLNGQIKSQGKTILTNSGNQAWYGSWIWYNKDGSIKNEKFFNQDL